MMKRLESLDALRGLDMLMIMGFGEVVLFAISVSLFVVGYFIANGFGPMSMQINKKLWSASYVFVMAGWSYALFASFHWIVDIKGLRSWSIPLQVIGLNSITIYLGQRFVPFGEIERRFIGYAVSHLPSDIGEFVLAVGYVVVCWLSLYFLHRKKIYLKI